MNIRRHQRYADARARQIITPEGLALTFTLASRGARLGALLLDLLLQTVLLIVVLVMLGLLAAGLEKLGVKGAIMDTPEIEFVVVLFFISFFVLRNGWFMFFELGARGATPGKRMLHIRIAARDGARLDAAQVIARNLLRDVELAVPFALVPMLGGETAGWLACTVWLLVLTCLPLWNRDALRAGDLIGGTWVVEAPRLKLASVMSVAVPAASARAAPSAQGPAAPLHSYQFGEAELAAYGEYELQTLERVLREDQVEAMVAVAEAICARIGWTAPGGYEVRAFLGEYSTQLRARLEAGMRFGTRKADKFTSSAPRKFRFTEAELAVYGARELQVLAQALHDRQDDALDAVAEKISAKIGRPTPSAADTADFLGDYYDQATQHLHG